MDKKAFTIRSWLANKTQILTVKKFKVYDFCFFEVKQTYKVLTKKIDHSELLRILYSKYLNILMKQYSTFCSHVTPIIFFLNYPLYV
jgi:hypothetical protein